MMWTFVLTITILSITVDSRQENQCPYETIRTPMVIESPLYEENVYPNFFRCSYQIVAPEDQIVSVKFTTFSLPPIRAVETMNYGPIEKECLSDYLQATISIDTEDHTLKFCGNELQNRRLLSTDNRMTLLFQSMNVNGFHANSFRGFRAEITFLEEDDFSYCDNTIVMAEEKISIEMDPGKECEMAIKAPAGKVPEVILAQQQGATNCDVDLKIDPSTTLPNGINDWNFKCQTRVTTDNKNINFIPFTLKNKGSDIAEFDILFNYREPTVQVCGQNVVMNNSSSTIDITLTPGRYNCIWTYTTKGTAFDTQQLTPSITLNSVQLASPETVNRQQYCLTNNLVVVLENAETQEPKQQTESLVCGKKNAPLTWTNSAVGKNMKAALIFFGRVPADQKAIIRGTVKLQ